MRNSDPIFWPGAEFDLSMQQQIERNYQDAIPTLQSQWLQADIDQRFVLGDQQLWGMLYPA